MLCNGVNLLIQRCHLLSPQGKPGVHNHFEAYCDLLKCGIRERTKFSRNRSFLHRKFKYRQSIEGRI